VRDVLFDSGDERVDVDALLSADRDDRRVLVLGSGEETLDLFVVLHRFFFGHEIDLVLNDDDMFDADDLERHEMLACLRLRAFLVRCDEEQCSVHDRGS